MKLSIFLALLFFLTPLLLAQKTSPVISYISSSPSQRITPVYSSYRGGTFIYMKVMSHSMMPSQNFIYVGSFPCIIPADGVTDNFISCETSDSGSNSDIYNLNVTIITSGGYFTTSSPNLVHYTSSATPQLLEIYPTSGFANHNINYYGLHRITYLGDGRDMGGVVKLQIGSDLCSRFDIIQPNISSTSYAYIRCLQSNQQVAGKYNLTEKVIPGLANRALALRKPSFAPQYFQFAVLPTVTSIFPSTGNLGGQNITILGTGFSLQASNNTVSVDGNNCAVSFSTQDKITCKLDPKNSSLTSLLTNTSASQKNGYISGAGLNYARYSISGSTSLTTFITAIRTNNSASLGNPKEKGIRTEIKQGDIYGTYYGQTWNGYFTAPTSGAYVFRGMGDHTFSFFISSVSGSTQLSSTTPLIYSNTNQQNWNNFYYTDRTTAEASITLNASTTYYIEAFHINYGGVGFFKVSVDVPNTDTTLPFQAYQIHKVIINSTVQPQIVVYTFTADSGAGQINLRIVRSGTSGITYNVNTTIDYGCNASMFLTALNQFDSFSKYKPSVVRNIYDEQNNTLSNLTNATIIEYVVSLFLFREESVSLEDFIYTKINYTGTITKSITTPHSPLITGNFSLSIGGLEFNDLPYNISKGTLESYLRTIVGYQKITVEQYVPNGPGISNTWIISYIGVNNAIPNVTVNPRSLSGGTTSPTIEIVVRRNYSSSITFEPIDYRFLNTYSSVPNVLVTTNGIPSVCTGSCGYTFTNYFEVTSLSLFDSTLLLSISSPLNLSIPIDTITILAQGLPCTILPSSNLSDITCNLTTNSDGTPLLVAGSFLPEIYVQTYGYASFTDGVSPITVSLSVTSLSTTGGGNNGGYYNTITGSNFPTEKQKISITVCNTEANVITSSNTFVKFFQPLCPTQDSQNIVVEVGSSSDSSLSFVYTNISSLVPVISSISPTSQNPTIKGVLTINGSGFGTDENQLSVFLTNSSGKAYQLKVISVNDSVIRAGLPGGYPGTFTVQVTKPNTTGDSIAATAGADQFQYLFSITSVSPMNGSYYGGSLLTITGTNFSPKSGETLVYIGDVLNEFCNIESISQTQITCRTPPINKKYAAEVPQRVVVSTKLYQLSSCPGDSCNFTYIRSQISPILANISIKANQTLGYTLFGTNFIAQSTCSISVTSTSDATIVYSFATDSCNNNSAQFTLPKTIPAGTYLVKVRNQIGESNGLGFKISWNIGLSSTNGSIAGNIITFTGGSGYPLSLGNGFNVMKKINNVISPIEIVACCSNNVLVLVIPPAPTGTIIYILFNSPTNSTSYSYLSHLSLTPTINLLLNSTELTPGSNLITFSVNSTLNPSITNLSLVSTIDPNNVIPIATYTNSSNLYSFTATLNSGSYKMVAITNYGYCQVNNIINVSLAGGLSTSSVVSSFAGGLFTITGNNLSPSSYITVNSFVGKIANYTPTAVTYNIPSLVAQSSQGAFNLKQVSLIDSKSFTLSSDQVSSVSNVTAAFDGVLTSIYWSSNVSCWIGIDVGDGLQATVHRFRFFPFMDWENTANYITDAVFEGSNNQENWTTMATVDQTVHNGWNVIRSSVSTPFRYFRFRHTNQSKCNLAEIQLYGIVSTSLSVVLSSHQAAVTYKDGYNSQILSGVIEFRQNRTPTVQSVIPAYGDVFGGYNISLIGTNLGFGVAVILIDSIPCTVQIANSSQIICLVGARSSIPKTNSFTVTIGGSNSVIVNGFLYVLKWSDSRTWGNDLPPIEGDLVYVPSGMTLLIDTDTPVLAGIAVQNGTLIFPNDTDVTVHTNFITLNGGAFIAGTESAPLHSNLKFVLYGNYFGKQQPMFGNKGIGCLNCKFSMYGRPRTPTWTTISATISPGSSAFTVSEDVDWQVGETIVVASTSFFHYEAEQRNIVSISGRTITVDSPFAYKHVSVVQTYGASDKLEMRAEVGLLTRNIKMMGDPTSVVGKYGSHLMLAGTYSNGLEGRVAYSQFTHCGQPQIVGRYCIHFHMAGEVPTSFVRGNAVHESFARVVTIHGVYLLLVEKNVGYRVKGHNFFVEDGIETHNTIRYNLAISSLAASNMLQTDTSVASFWITNPTNDFYGNHAAGGDFYGIWYQIKQNPDGPSATNDVCPIGNPLGYVANNVAHSNTRFGLRIFKLYSRKSPCTPIRRDSNASDPWFSNPSIPSIYHNFTIYKNLEDGVLAQQTGNVIFNNFTIAQNYRAGVQFYVANFTRQMPSVNNSVIIGQSQTNVASDTSNYTKGMAGAITPRSGQTNITNTRFYNYPAGTTMIKTCSFCDDSQLFTNLGTQLFVKNLTFTNVNGNYLFMIGMKRDVIYDLDASLAVQFDGNGNNRTTATIVSNWPHIANYQNSRCVSSSTPSKWDNAILCDQTATIRRIFITNALDITDFANQFMHIAQLNSIDQVVPTNTSLKTSIKSTVNQMEPMKQRKRAWSLPYIAGQIYQIWWGTGIDFSHISIVTSHMYSPSDLGVIFKFPYVENRELFNVGPMRGGNLLVAANYIKQDVDPGLLNASTCVNGQYYHNNSIQPRMLAICQSGKNRTMYEYTEVNAVVCLYACPPPAGVFIKENFVRRWSNATQWPNGTLPKAGDNVTVNGNWTVILDIDPAPANYLTIDGTVVADDTRDVFISARSIFIRAGNLTVGSPSSPFQHKFTIQVNNTKNDKGWYIDPLVAGNKYIIITGVLNLYGSPPATVQTSLTRSVFAGQSQIYVRSSLGWSVGDSIALSPSYSKYFEHETVKITAINANGSLSISPPLKYNHYGSTSLISTPQGSIDVNAHVAHLNRNIKIIAGPDYSWGVNILVYGFNDTGIVRVGSINFKGVEIQDGGQQDTTSAALQFLNVVNGNQSSTVKATSFVNCQSWCVNINNAQNVAFSNNVFYIGRVFGVRATSIKNFQFTNNLFIGIIRRASVSQIGELVACFATFDYVDPATSGVLVKDNFCLGSQSHGFAFPHIKCNQIQVNPFAGNTAGSCNIGFIINNIADTCKAFSDIKVYSSNIGNIVGSFGTKKLIFTRFISIDNERGITMKFGDAEGGTSHTGILTNSYISTISRPSCSYCYGTNKIDCVANIGMRMLTVTGNGETLPKQFGKGFDVICKAQSYENKVYMTNVTFDNYKQTYSGLLSNCSNNFVLQPHPIAVSSIADHNLFNVACTNCDTHSYLSATPNNPQHIGWFGGCGDILCTGRSNYLINDWTGNFLPFIGSIVPNNSMIGNNEAGCTFSAPMNAYICNRSDFATLAYQSTAADFKTRVMWPVNLTYDGSNYTTVTNAWREWEWLGKEPQNRRFGRFMSIVKLNSTYNMSFASMPPLSMQYQIQKRSPGGNSSNYIIVKLQYPKPNMIQIKVNGIVQDPILVTDTGLDRNLSVSTCGDNAYFYTNYTTHFVITEDINCLVDLALTDTIQLTTHFAMNATSFMATDLLSRYIDRLCSMLGITDTSRVKVVGVLSGSTIVQTIILQATTNSTSNTTSSNGTTSGTNGTSSGTTTSSGPSLSNIQSILSSSNAAITSSLATQLNTTVLTLSSTLYTVSSPQNNQNKLENVGLIIGIALAGTVLLVTFAFTSIYCLRRRVKVEEQIGLSESQIFQKKEKPRLVEEKGVDNFELGSYTSDFKVNHIQANKIMHQQVLDE